jgi:hypothetical protein
MYANKEEWGEITRIFYFIAIPMLHETTPHREQTPGGVVRCYLDDSNGSEHKYKQTVPKAAMLSAHTAGRTHEAHEGPKAVFQRHSPPTFWRNDGGGVFYRHVGRLSTQYTALYPRR